MYRDDRVKVLSRPPPRRQRGNAFAVGAVRRVGAPPSGLRFLCAWPLCQPHKLQGEGYPTGRAPFKL